MPSPWTPLSLRGRRLSSTARCSPANEPVAGARNRSGHRRDATRRRSSAADDPRSKRRTHQPPQDWPAPARARRKRPQSILDVRDRCAAQGPSDGFFSCCILPWSRSFSIDEPSQRIRQAIPVSKLDDSQRPPHATSLPIPAKSRRGGRRRHSSQASSVRQRWDTNTKKIDNYVILAF